MSIIFWIIVAYLIVKSVSTRTDTYKNVNNRTLLIDDVRDIQADVVARTFDEGIDALKHDYPFTTLYLDHDLASYDEDGKEKTGYDIMCFLEQNPEYLPEKIYCVSSNPVGRQKIQVVIDKLYNGESK
jgi:hypothetical protein